MFTDDMVLYAIFFKITEVVMSGWWYRWNKTGRDLIIFVFIYEYLGVYYSFHAVSYV